MMPDLLRYSLEYLRWHKLLPTTRWGDRAYAKLHCLRFNGHLPREKGGDLTDFLAFMKGHPEMETRLRQRLSDKAQLKLHVAQQLGPAYCIPTYGMMTTRAEVDAFNFPTSCVIKTTHSSGQVVIRKTGEPVDRQRLKNWLKINHYLRGRERNYRGLSPAIMVEQWLSHPSLIEFKVHCLRGEPRDTLMFRSVRGRDGLPLLIHYLNPDGQMVDLRGASATHEEAHELWKRLFPGRAVYLQVLDVARTLSQGMLYARIDLYYTGEAIKVGEVTSANHNGILTSYGADFERLRGQRVFGLRGFCLEDFPELQ